MLKNGVKPKGIHLCQFYKTKEELTSVLVPYFALGLKNNEFCMWVTSPPLDLEEAKSALQNAVPDLDRYISKEQFKIVPYDEWYLKGGPFDRERVLKGLDERRKVG